MENDLDLANFDASDAENSLFLYSIFISFLSLTSSPSILITRNLLQICPLHSLRSETTEYQKYP